MKLIALAASTLCLGVMSSTAFSQTCSSPTVLASGSTVNGNTCGGDQSFTDICGGATLKGPSNVYTWTYGGGTVSGSIVVTPTGGAPTFDPALAIVNGSATCSGSVGTCDVTADANANSSAETVSLTGLNTNGPYFLIISSFSTTAANQCGPYSLQAGTLPVKLQSFSIN